MPNVVGFRLHAPPLICAFVCPSPDTTRDGDKGYLVTGGLPVRRARDIGVGKALSFQAFSIDRDGGEPAPLTGDTRLRSGSQER